MKHKRASAILDPALLEAFIDRACTDINEHALGDTMTTKNFAANILQLRRCIILQEELQHRTGKKYAATPLAKRKIGHRLGPWAEYQKAKGEYGRAGNALAVVTGRMPQIPKK